MKYFVMWFVAYISLSIASQFLTSTPFELFTIAGVAIWMPLSALTLVPLVDVFRSFTQNSAEKVGLDFKRVATMMLVTTLVVSFLCVQFAGLPLPIFAGVLAAVTIGGALDILVFRRMGKFFTSPVKRMAVSNLVATLVGSGIVFLVAFTDVVFTENALAKPYLDAVVGWLSQSTFIWLSSIALAFVTSKFIKE